MIGTMAERQKLSDRACEEIRSRIVDGTFPMGRKLPESELCDLLGMSKSPVREALLHLHSEGLVEMPADRTARVFSMGAEEIAELGELRRILEGQALGLAMVRQPQGLSAALEAIVARMEQAMAAGDAAGYRMLDHDFHAAILARCGNSYLDRLFQTLGFRVQALRNRLSRDARLNRISLEEHLALRDLVRAGDRSGALALLDRHVAATTRNYLAGLNDRADPGPGPATLRVLPAEIDRFARAALAAVGADAPTAEAVVRALGHASVLGVDTHGYRLLPHYLEGFARGRLNPAPVLRVIAGQGGAAVLDGGDGHGARVTYAAVDLAVERARAHGLGAVAIRNSSHFGAAGAYALAIAEQGMMGLAVCNSDSFVRLHGGAERFHGTNPIAAAAPSAGGAPWLLDMATSSIPYNRVQLSQSLGVDLPPEVASDGAGQNVTDPARALMLAPLGGALFGYKGAGLAGLSEILSTAFSDAPLSVELPEMISDDMATPRHLGAFVLALDPAAFAGADVFGAVVARYGARLRGSVAAPGGQVRAPGDREWQEAAQRREIGIRLDRITVRSLNAFAAARSLPPLVPASAAADDRGSSREDDT